MKQVDCSKLRRNRALRNSPMIADQLEARFGAVYSRIDAFVYQAKREGAQQAAGALNRINKLFCRAQGHHESCIESFYCGLCDEWMA